MNSIITTFNPVTAAPLSSASADTVEARIEGAFQCGVDAVGVAGRTMLEALYKVSTPVYDNLYSPLSLLYAVPVALADGKAAFAAVDAQLRLSLNKAVSMLPTGAEFMHGATSGEGALSAAVLVARGFVSLGSAGQALGLLPGNKDMAAASYSGFGLFSAAFNVMRSTVNLVSGPNERDAEIRPGETRTLIAAQAQPV